jgi:hypothetical protein
MLLHQLIEQSKQPEAPAAFRKLQSHAEDLLAKHVYSNLEKMTPEAEVRFSTFLALFLS